jgi:16S rRNA (guanine966-N2)-methyltransferase
MRIIAGKYKNREIFSPSGKTTRPVLTRVRKAIFDTAGPVVDGARVLDLFAGSGGFVIEALSRGAISAVAVDLDGGAVKAIRANLAHCKVDERVDVYKNDAFDAIEKLRTKAARFELIAVAPPYWKGFQARALTAIDAGQLLAEGGLLFVQSDAKEDFSADMPLLNLRFRKRKDYGNTVVDWYTSGAAEVNDEEELRKTQSSQSDAEDAEIPES